MCKLKNTQDIEEKNMIFNCNGTDSPVEMVCVLGKYLAKFNVTCYKTCKRASLMTNRS